MKTNKICEIHNFEVKLDGEIIFQSETKNFAEFAKEFYKKINIDYPKFHKMDNLTKLAFLASELCLSAENQKDTALIFANKSSSLDTDLKHQQSINDKENYFPSPAVFVYTLPNICLGEISIRHQLQTENIFFVMEDFNRNLLDKYAENLLKSGKATQALCGWVELLGDYHRAFVYLLNY